MQYRIGDDLHIYNANGEEWRDIPGWEGMYQVSNCGKVRSLPRHAAVNKRHPIVGRLLVGRVLHDTYNTCGYKHVALYRDGKSRRKTVHSLVALAFIGQRPEGYIINHKDGDKTNNRLENLEYVTHLENTQHAWQIGLSYPDMIVRGIECHLAKLTESDVLQIKWMLAQDCYNSYEIAELFRVSRTVITSINRGKTWKHVGNYTYPISRARVRRNSLKSRIVYDSNGRVILPISA